MSIAVNIFSASLLLAAGGISSACSEPANGTRSNQNTKKVVDSEQPQGGDDDEDKDPINDAQGLDQDLSLLNGSWKTPCYAGSNGAFFWTTDYRVSNTSVTSTDLRYMDQDCRFALSRNDEKQTWRVGKPDSNGVFEFDRVIVEAYETVTNYDYFAQNFPEGKTRCGDPVELNKKVLIKSEDCSGPDSHTIYDIGKLEDDRILTGIQEGSLDGSTPEKRPVNLDFGGATIIKR